MSVSQAQESPNASSAGSGRSVLTALVQRWPFLAFCLVIVLSNGAGSIFNITYNTQLIVKILPEGHKDAFWNLVLPTYNIVAYSYCLGVIAYLLWPLVKCRRLLCAGSPVPLELTQRCRLLVVNLPYHAVYLELVGWLPGAILFPLGICLKEGWWEDAWIIWLQFPISFGVSALLTTTQTFYALEAFLIRFYYPIFLQGARPAAIPGAKSISLGTRLTLYWFAVAFVPMVALLAVAVNLAFRKSRSPHDPDTLGYLAIGVTVVAVISTGFIALMVGSTLVRWVKSHAAATEQIARENFDVRINEQRPDEWGKLTDRFNDMAAELGKARYVRETFGQVVGPEVADFLLLRDSGLGGEVEEITVMFADIRGFTQRSAGEQPDRAVQLLNRYLSLAVDVIEDKARGGLVNKFLGDGIMALFGSPHPRSDHADQAVWAACRMLARLDSLNQELAAEGQEPLKVGIGIHTGPALCGSIGATMKGEQGKPRFRKEFTAIGETVNLCQRLEQMTKVHGGPILISEQTRSQLTLSIPLIDLGCQPVPGFEGTLHIHRVQVEMNGELLQRPL